MLRRIMPRLQMRLLHSLCSRTQPAMLLCSAPVMRSTSFRFASTNDDDVDMAFDPTASLQREAAAAQVDQVRDKILRDWLPSNAPDAAINKLRKSLHDFPVDQMIVCPQVKITHVENDAGVEESMKLDAVDRAEALEQAALRGMNLVQMAERNGVAFARIRNEKKRMLKVLEPELAAADGASEAPSQTFQKQKPCIDHSFRDVVDAHFIGWKSKKIAQDIRKGHPVKMIIQEFQTADSAIAKMREMCNAIKTVSEEQKIYHHYTGIHASDRELSVTLAPARSDQKNSSAQVKHPGEKEWNHTIGRMGGALRASGRMGTYSKANELKPRNVGMSTYRVDKYGRKIA